jgi:hypothetical protein
VEIPAGQFQRMGGKQRLMALAALRTVAEPRPGYPVYRAAPGTNDVK